VTVAATTDRQRHRAWRCLLRKLRADPTRPDGYAGRWPSSWQSFLWDLGPSAVAPENDGVVAPTWSVPNWIASAPENQLGELIEAERRRHGELRAQAETSEGKASRLLTPMVTLVTGSVALVALQLHAAARAHTTAGQAWLVVAALPGVAAVLLLFVAISRCMDAGLRVGVYQAAGAQALAGQDQRSVLGEEHLAAERALWTARLKATRLMYARSAFSRAVVFLTMSLAAAAITVAANAA